MRVLITGASGALGQVLVSTFLAHGHQVAGLVRSGHDVASSTYANTFYFPVSDLSDPNATAAATAQAVKALGGLDVLVNTAGGYAWETIKGGEFETWQRMFDANVKTTLAATLAALPHLQAEASIINVGTASAQPAALGTGAYAAAKSGVARLTESLADELKPRKIRVNAVLPGIIDTPVNRAAMPEANPATWVKTEAIADVILFLAGHSARAINGALIPVTNPG